MLEIKSTVEKETKSNASNLKEESLKTYVDHQRGNRKNSGSCQRYAQEKILKSSWFLLRVSKLSDCNSNIHEIFVYRYVFAHRAATKLTE